MSFLLQEGEELITEFLTKFKCLPLSSLSDEEAVKEIEKLKQDIQAKSNPFIQDILAKGSVC